MNVTYAELTESQRQEAQRLFPDVQPNDPYLYVLQRGAVHHRISLDQTLAPASDSDKAVRIVTGLGTYYLRPNDVSGLEPGLIGGTRVYLRAGHTSKKNWIFINKSPDELALELGL